MSLAQVKPAPRPSPTAHPSPPRAIATPVYVAQRDATMVRPGMSNAAIAATASQASMLHKAPAPLGASNAAVSAAARSPPAATLKAPAALPGAAAAASRPRTASPRPDAHAKADGATKPAEQTPAGKHAPADKARGAASAAATAPGKAAAQGKVTAAEPGDALANLAALPASGMLRGLNATRQSSAGDFNRMHAHLANTPPTLERPSGLPRKPGPTDGQSPAAAPVKAAAPEQPKPGAQPLPPIEPDPMPVPLPASTVDPGELDRIPDDAPDEFAAYAQQMLGSVPETDKSVDTSAGERPTVSLKDDADPAQMARPEAAHRAAADTAWVGARAGMTEPEGENNIYPTVPKETLKAHLAGTRLPAAKQRPGASVLDRPEVAAAVDGAAGAKWAEETAKAQQDNAAAVQEKEADEGARRDETAAQIAQAEQDAIGEQTDHQVRARKEVAAARMAWSDELDAADQAYTKKAKTLRDDHQTQIDKTQKDADDQAKEKLDKAEADAEAEKKAKTAEAEAKKKEAKKESGGFWGWVKSKAKALISAIRSAVNKIFNALRSFVKFIIDKAKKFAVWLIEQARKAIVGLIRAFGKLLEMAADVFLAFFPKARAKAKAWIRRGVTAAENGVNAVADTLKKGVCKLLDALGAALDFVLAVYQKAYNLILDAVEFVVVGLIEIIEGIGRLADAASMVGDHFLGAIEKEGIGVDLTEPLPMEKPAGAVGIGTAAQSAVASGAISSGDAALLSRSSLDASDVAVELVAQLNFEPELLETVLPLAANGDYHFGENDEPQNQRDAVLSNALAAQTGEAAAGPAMAGEATASPAAAADPTQMTPDEQIAYLNAQEMPHACNAQKSEEPAKEDALPASMRIYGPFTPGQRFSYMWSQIKKGISQWWSCNWGKVVVGLAVGALIALLLGILTGGAIFAAIPPFLDLLAAWLVGAAMWKAKSYIGDYLSLAWNGNPTGGAKALASAFAILLIELIFALLFNIGAVIKAIKSGLKGTVRAAAGAVKGAIKGTLEAGGELVHAGVAAFKAGVKNSKLIVKGFRQGFGEGIRSVGQLTREMLAKVRFRGFLFRLKGRLLQIWGRLNPWVLLGEGKVEWREVKGKYKVGDVVKLADTLEDAIVVGKRGKPVLGSSSASSAYVGELEKLTEKQLKAKYEELAALGKEARREAILGATKTAENARALRKDMEANGKELAEGQHAHHIVPSTHPRAKEARKILEDANVGINLHRNGAALDASVHAPLHTNAYIDEVTNFLRGAKSEAEVTARLAKLEKLIKAGKFPP